MDSPAHTIRDCLAEVASLRDRTASDPRLASACHAIKRLQADRFRACYADLLRSERFGRAARFFLEELYSEQDYSARDRQFARIAGALATAVPQAAVQTAVDLSRLHALTEALDFEMATHCAHLSRQRGELNAEAYISAWRAVDRDMDRRNQLHQVLAIGCRLAQLTRLPGLAMLLRLMRRPAAAAGLGDLQRFLENGFEIFRSMGRSRGTVDEFLQTIQARESAWLDILESDTPDARIRALEGILASQ